MTVFSLLRKFREQLLLCKPSRAFQLPLTPVWEGGCFKVTGNANLGLGYQQATWPVAEGTGTIFSLIHAVTEPFLHRT